MADNDLSHVRAFANCVVNEIMWIDMERNEAAKTTFIASMSHELRSPLHGILGAAEFLVETTTNAYEAGLVSSIITCGKTLLDTLNHVLDHSKINKLKVDKKHTRTSEQGRLAANGSLNNDEDVSPVDLGALVEEVADVVTAGHTFKTISSYSSAAASVPLSSSDQEYSLDTLTAQGEDACKEPTLGVTVLLDITPRHSWMVKVPHGSLQRIIMNLFGNALKYTSTGFVALSLRTLETPGADKIAVLIRVVDSGKGISNVFQQQSLFVPFSQEDSFQPGTGLGLSIVKQIVDSLGGSIELRSTPGSGTEVDVYLRLPTERLESPRLELPVPNSSREPSEMHRYPLAMAAKLMGKKLVLLDPLDPDKTRSPLHQASRFQQTLRETCENWFGMEVIRSTSMEREPNVAMYLYGEPPPIEMLRHHKRSERHRSVPVILACQNDHDAVAVIRHQQKFLRELGEIVEVIQQPCGPRKLAKTFMYCLKRAEEINGPDSSLTSPPGTDTKDLPSLLKHHNPSLPHRPAPAARLSSRTTGQVLRKGVSAALAPPTLPSLDPETPYLKSAEIGDTTLDLLNPRDASSDAQQHGTQQPSPLPAPPTSKLHLLLVDDNKINRQLLVMFMKKHNFTYLEAENGREAVDLFAATLRSSSSSSQAISFDYILMDISMPVMDGMEATRNIRNLEGTQGGKRTKIFALTGLASEKAREEAEVAGVDLFLPKPVKFAELRGFLV